MKTVKKILNRLFNNLSKEEKSNEIFTNGNCLSFLCWFGDFWNLYFKYNKIWSESKLIWNTWLRTNYTWYCYGKRSG